MWFLFGICISSFGNKSFFVFHSCLGKPLWCEISSIENYIIFSERILSQLMFESLVFSHFGKCSEYWADPYETE